MKPLTKEQKSAYLANPDLCPVCQSDCISNAGDVFDSEVIWRYWICESCGASYSDEYRLTDVELDEEY